VQKCQVSVRRDLMLLLLRTKTLARDLLAFWRMIDGKEVIPVISIY
jgi:hypothetical protein